MSLIHVVYGFSENGWNGRRFRRALSKFDLEHTNNIHEADYVVTHSAGCFKLPPLRDDQILVLINPPYWPGKSVAERAYGVWKQNIYETFQGEHRFYHVVKFFNFLWCLVRRARTNFMMYQQTKTFDLAKIITHRKSVLFHNHGDPWLTPDLSTLKRANPKLQIHELPGYHDDCWVNPDPYLELIRMHK